MPRKTANPIGFRPGMFGADSMKSGPKLDRRGRPELERVLEDRCVKRAWKQYGLLSRKMNGLGYNHWPDREFLPPARKGRVSFIIPCLWVEFKRWGEPPTPAQRELHADLRLRGQWVAVIDNDAAFDAVVEDYVGYVNRKY